MEPNAITFAAIVVSALACALGARRDLRLPIPITLAAFVCATLATVTMFGPATAPIAALVLACLLITETDRRQHLIPDPMTLALLPLAFVMPFGDSIATQLIGALSLGAMFLTIRQVCNKWRGVDTLGLGDVKLAGAMGAVLGPTHGFVAVAVAGAATIAVLTVRGRGEATMAGAPFGIGLAAATAVVAVMRMMAS